MKSNRIFDIYDYIQNNLLFINGVNKYNLLVEIIQYYVRNNNYDIKILEYFVDCTILGENIRQLFDKLELELDNDKLTSEKLNFTVELVSMRNMPRNVRKIIIKRNLFDCIIIFFNSSKNISIYETMF